MLASRCVPAKRAAGDALVLIAKVTRRAIPVRQHPAFAVASVDNQLVPRRAVSVAVDQAADAMFAESGNDRFGVDVHDLLGLVRGRAATASAQHPGNRAA